MQNISDQTKNNAHQEKDGVFKVIKATGENAEICVS